MKTGFNKEDFKAKEKPPKQQVAFTIVEILPNPEGCRSSEKKLEFSGSIGNLKLEYDSFKVEVNQ